MEIKCEGGMLDGKVIAADEPEEVLHQHGLAVLRAHEPYPKRKGEKITERLLTYTEDYALTMTEDGPVYRVVAPFGGVRIGDEALEPSEGGTYEVFKGRDGKWHACPDSAQ